MSRATNEAITLLALVAGCFSEINKRKLISRVDIKKLVLEGHDLAVKAINSWGETGDARANTAWIEQALATWDQKFYKGTDPTHRLEVLVAVADRVMVDLHGRLRNPKRRALIDGLLKVTAGLLSFSDREGRNFPAFEEAGACVDELYKIMGFEI